RFRIVVFDDPYYYPYRYYGGTRVVFTRPLRPAPRFIFKDRQGSSLFVTRVPQRPVTDDRRRDVGVRGRDLGSGSIPPPNIQPRQRPITGGGPPLIERPRERPITRKPAAGRALHARARPAPRGVVPAPPRRAAAQRAARGAEARCAAREAQERPGAQAA